MSNRLVLALAVAVIAAAGAVTALLVFGGDDGGEDERFAVGRVVDPEECSRLADDEARTCYARAFSGVVGAHRDPRPVVESIAEMAWSRGGYLLANCHGVMHTVGREYAQDVQPPQVEMTGPYESSTQ
ncbi:MAG TPA: hypothetical protein VE270_03300, partial [Thermoleophilaceae bacterium]|nr:hypothetical protein [Thermoleophilaceae bacterium]